MQIMRILQVAAGLGFLAFFFPRPASAQLPPCQNIPSTLAVASPKLDVDEFFLRVGQSVQLKVTEECSFFNGAKMVVDVTNQVTYVSGDPAITVSPGGLVTALGYGTPGPYMIITDPSSPNDAVYVDVDVLAFTPKFVFAPDDCITADDCSQGSVSVFTVDLNSGALALVPGSPFPSGGQYALSVAPHPTLSLVFVLNEFVNAGDHSTGSIQIFSVDPARGVLAPVGPPVSSLGFDPGTITTDPSGKFVLVAHKCLSAADCSQGGVAVFSFDPATKALSPVGTYGSRYPGARYLTVAPSGRFLFVTNVGAVNSVQGSVTAFSMDPSTGALSGAGVAGAASTGRLPSRVAVDPFSKFAYVVSYCTFSSSNGNGDPCVTNAFVQGFDINSTSGALTQLGGFPFILPAEGSGSLATDPLGKFLYVDNGYLNGGTTILTESIDPNTGALTPVGSPPALGRFEPHPSFLTCDPSGKFVYAIAIADQLHEGVAVFARSDVTGALTQVTGSAFAEPLISLEQIAVMGNEHDSAFIGGELVYLIALNPVVSLGYGQTYQYSVAAKLVNPTDIHPEPDVTEFLTNTVKWSTSNPSIVTISPNGLATATGPGTATITACFTFLYCATSTVTATGVKLVTTVSPTGAGTISPVTALHALGASVQVAAAANPGYTFSGFSGALTGNTTPQTLTLNSDALVTANFAPLQPSLTASVGPRTDAFAAGTRNVPITLMNSGKASAANASIISISDVAVISGSGTVFALSAVFPENLGAIPIGGSATGNVIFNWPATATRVRFTVNFGADGGYAGSTVITSFR